MGRLTALGVVPTGPTEMSLDKQAYYAQPTCHLLRYTLRTDGFVSVNAPHRGGAFVAKPLTFVGKKLLLDFSTSAAGNLRVKLQGADGTPLPGSTLAEASELIGDQIERVASWKQGANVSPLVGQTVRPRFMINDAEVHSLRFRPEVGVAPGHSGSAWAGSLL